MKVDPTQGYQLHSCCLDKFAYLQTNNVMKMFRIQKINIKFTLYLESFTLGIQIYQNQIRPIWNIEQF